VQSAENWHRKNAPDGLNVSRYRRILVQSEMWPSAIVEQGLRTPTGPLCREVLYWLHPWFGREVFVHTAIDKADGAVFQCSVDGSDVERWLEVPAWMFDHGACAGDVRFSTAPFVCLEALSALSTLLDQFRWLP
jgi:hypothetical protein